MIYLGFFAKGGTSIRQNCIVVPMLGLLMGPGVSIYDRPDCQTYAVSIRRFLMMCFPEQS